ncbi:MAG TPA: hypothetical protein VJN18_13295 [Polyangiaceae bacterium]|nr:hypothetical protein [Polyangiaceae bacterium]
MNAATASPSYLSSAFYSQYNLILLGGAALFSLASASLVPLMVGVTIEVLWLGLGSRLSAFRQRVDVQVETERRARVDDDVLGGMRGLGSDHTARLVALEQAISAISARASTSGGPIPIAALAELDQLRPLFLRHCQLHERLSRRLQELVLAPPAEEVAKLSRAYAAERDLGARYTLHQAIKLAQRRVEQQARMLEMRREIEQKLALIERVPVQLYSQRQLGLSNADLAADMHALTASVGIPTAFEVELNELGVLSVLPPSVAPAR